MNDHQLPSTGIKVFSCYIGNIWFPPLQYTLWRTEIILLPWSRENATSQQERACNNEYATMSMQQRASNDYEDNERVTVMTTTSMQQQWRQPACNNNDDNEPATITITNQQGRWRQRANNDDEDPFKRGNSHIIKIYTAKTTTATTAEPQPPQ